MTLIRHPGSFSGVDMDFQSVLRLARMFRLGAFPRTVSGVDWLQYPAIRPGERRGVVDAAGRIADADQSPDSFDADARMSDYYPDLNAGPLGSLSATLDFDLQITRPGIDPFYRHVRITVGWSDTMQTVMNAIEDVVSGWKAAYGDMAYKFGAGSFYIW